MDQTLNSSIGGHSMVAIEDGPKLDTTIPLVEDAYFIFQRVISWVIVFIGFPGIVGNILTILVFMKLGLKETINMSYVALAVSDICSLTAAMIVCIFNTSIMEILFHHFQVKIPSPIIPAAIGVWPQLAFSRTTGLLTAWISFQRCLIVVLPIRGKLIATPTVSKIAIAVTFLASCGPIVITYIGLYPVWMLDSKTNRTLFSLYKDKNTMSRTVSATLYGTFYPLFSLMIVVVCTVCLTIKLKASLKWRQQIVRTGQTSDVAAKENRITKTVAIIAGIFIVCSLPLSAHTFAVTTVRGYRPGQTFQHLFQVGQAVVLLLSHINSSVNILAFASQGFKFRAALFGMLRGWFGLAHKAS